MLRDGLDRGRVAVEGPDHGRQEGVLALTTDVPEVVRGDVPHHDAAEAHVRRVLGLRDGRRVTAIATDGTNATIAR